MSLCIRYNDAHALPSWCPMTAITIPLSEDRLARLHELAKQLGVTPEELARAGLEDWLAQPREDFRKAADYVLRKNAELYRRLA